MPDECVQVCVTSPPYYGLRDYGLPPSVWGGSTDCAHEWGEEGKSKSRIRNGQGASSLNGGRVGLDANVTLHPSQGAFCALCGAWRGCLGQEPTPEMFLGHLVALFREVRRVLRSDGTCWVNLGDSYSGSGKGPTGHNGIGDQSRRQGFADQRSGADCWSLKAKDLMMLPARFAIAMQAEGWYLRSRITWCKKSAMPESVSDRPMNATEDIYLFGKSARYAYDADAVRQPHLRPDHDGTRNSVRARAAGGTLERGPSFVPAVREYNPLGANLRNFWLLGPEPSAWDFCGGCGRLFVGPGRKAITKRDGQRVCPCGASDWVAHYATFPSELPRRAILAGTSAHGACATCGAGWARVVERGGLVSSGPNKIAHKPKSSHRDLIGRWEGPLDGRGVDGYGDLPRRERSTTGWQPSCRCETTDTRGAVVLDIFSGSATTGRVALQLGRRYIGLELSERYARASEALMLREVEKVAAAKPVPMRRRAAPKRATATTAGQLTFL